MNPALTAPCDRAIAATARDLPGRRPELTLLASILASSLAFIDGSVVNVALPAIGTALGAGAAGLQWIINAYMLPLSALLLLGGAAGDRYGRRRIFLAGIAVFALASVLCAASGSLGGLLAGRALQGVGAAMLMPNSLSLLGSAFAGEARGRAIGTWAAAGAIAGALGPLAGGWLVDALGWRWIFLVNLPVAAGALWLGARHVPADRDDAGQPLDWLGALLATMGLGGVTWSLTILSNGGSALRDIVIGAAGFAALAAFLLVERRRGARAMMPSALFATRAFAGLTLLTLALYGALGGLLVLLPYMLIVGGGYSAVAAGAALLPLPAVIGIASRFMGRVAGRIGPWIPLSLGSLIVAAGFALATRIDPAGGYWATVFPPILVIAIGMAGAVAPLTTAVMASVDTAHVGAANGFNSAVARTGGLVATALLGGVLMARGGALYAAFDTAAWACAAAALVAALSAALLVRPAASSRRER